MLSAGVSTVKCNSAGKGIQMEQSTQILLSIREAAALIGLSEVALRSHIQRGTGPTARRLSPRRIVIHQDDLFIWIDQLEKVRRTRLGGVPRTEIVIDLNQEGARGDDD